MTFRVKKYLECIARLEKLYCSSNIKDKAEVETTEQEIECLLDSMTKHELATLDSQNERDCLTV
jgi:hypothetical protein